VVFIEVIYFIEVIFV